MKTIIVFALSFWLGGLPARAAQADFDPQACFACHSEVSDLWSGGKHKGKLSCVQCHGKLDAHLKSPENKPETNLDPALCGKCHKNQFETFFKTNPKKTARLEKSLLTERSPNPYWDKLMAGHGFTKEHNAPRSHAYMVVDHLVVDRAFGGRLPARRGGGRGRRLQQGRRPAQEQPQSRRPDARAAPGAADRPG